MGGWYGDRAAEEDPFWALSLERAVWQPLWAVSRDSSCNFSLQSAERLGLTAIYVTQLAAEEKSPAVFQDQQWWFDPDRIEMIRRARRARRDRVVARPRSRRGGSGQSIGFG